MLAQAWVTLRSRWLLLVGAGVIIFIPVGLLEVLSAELQDHLNEGDADIGHVIQTAVTVVLLGSGALLGDILYAGVVAAVVVDGREGRRRSLREVLAHLPVLRLLGADLLLGLLVVIGLLLLVLPGLAALAWFALVAPVIEVERTGIRAAFRRSRALVRGHFWFVFAIVVPVALISEAIAVYIESGAVWTLGDGFLGEWAGGVLANVLTAPLFALAVVILFFELRQGHE